MKQDLKKETLDTIKNGNIQMRSRAYFGVLKAAIYILTSILLIAAIYLFNLTFYLPARTLRIAQREGLSEYLSLFPWTLILAGAIIVGTLIYIYRHYEGGYKKHLGITALAIFAIVLIGGMVAARSNLNEKLEERPRFQRFYQWNEDNLVPRGPRNRLHEPRFNYAPEHDGFNPSETGQGSNF